METGGCVAVADGGCDCREVGLRDLLSKIGLISGCQLGWRDRHGARDRHAAKNEQRLAVGGGFRPCEVRQLELGSGRRQRRLHVIKVLFGLLWVETGLACRFGEGWYSNRYR